MTASIFVSPLGLIGLGRAAAAARPSGGWRGVARSGVIAHIEHSQAVIAVPIDLRRVDAAGAVV